MKRFLIAAIIASVVAIAVESSAASKEGAIKEVFGRLDRCLADNDASCVGGLFVDDGTFSEPLSGAKITKGKPQIVKNLEGLLKGAPAMKGASRTHSVVNVRMIGEDHAFVDCSVGVAGMKAAAGQGSASPSSAYHAVALVVLQGDKWLLKDIRSYGVGPSVVPNKPESVTATTVGNTTTSVGNTTTTMGK